MNKSELVEAVAKDTGLSKKVLQKEGYGALISNPSAVSSRIGGRGGAVQV